MPHNPAAWPGDDDGWEPVSVPLDLAAGCLLCGIVAGIVGGVLAFLFSYGPSH